MMIKTNVQISDQLDELINIYNSKTAVSVTTVDTVRDTYTEHTCYM